MIYYFFFLIENNNKIIRICRYQVNKGKGLDCVYCYFLFFNFNLFY